MEWMKRLARGKTTAYQKQQQQNIWVSLLLDYTVWKGNILVLTRVPEYVLEMERQAYHFHSFSQT